MSALRLVTFGLHVHVGVDTGDKAITICDRMMRHLPLLLRAFDEFPVLGGSQYGTAFQPLQDHGGSAHSRTTQPDA